MLPRRRERAGATAFLQPPTFTGMSSLISDIGRMSIAEGNSESGSELYDSDPDEEYTILNAVTKTIPTPSSPSCSSKPNSMSVHGCDGGCDGASEYIDGGSQNRPKPKISEVQPTVQDTPTLVNGRLIPDMIEGNGGHSLEANDTIPIQPPVPAVLQNCTNSDLPSTEPWQFLPDMDLLVIVHSHPVPGACQKFLCNNTNEVNLMYHCWLFPDIPFDSSITVSEKLEMGVFEPVGVQPVHLDLDDAGVPFYFLDNR